MVGAHRLRVRLFGLDVDAVTARQATACLREHLARHGCGQKPDLPVQVVVTLNPEMVMQARRDLGFLRLLEQADWRVPDGVGIVWACRLLGQPVPERVAGIELAEALLQACAELKVGAFLLGGRPGVAEEAARRLARRIRGLEVTGSWHGYFAEGSPEEQQLLEKLRQLRPGLLLVGMGSPRQERWMMRHRSQLQGAVAVAVGVGGSLDVWAGRVARAPWLFRRTGTEWLYRLLRQPWRARRMLALPQFAWLAVREAARMRVFGGASNRPI